MKKLRYFIFTIFLGIVFPLTVWAASGKIQVTGSSTVVVNNNVTISVTLSSSSGIGSWQMFLKYDKQYLKLIKSDADDESTGMVDSSSNKSGVKSKTYKFTFRALKTGSTNITVEPYEAYLTDLSEMSLTVSSKTIKIITQEELEASYSKNNDLSSLEIEGATLTPEFNKDTLEYQAIVAEDTKEINLKAQASDSKSTLTGVGKHEVTSGSNTFEVVVRAENGLEKTYKVVVEVKDANPINVEVDGEPLTVVKLRENLPSAPAYQESTITISGFEIPCYTSEFTNLTLVGLKDSLGNINLYIYNDNNYVLYQEIGFNKITIYPLENSKEIEGYQKMPVEINGSKVNGYVLNKDSRFIIIYGVNVGTGEKDFYLYDKKDQTIMKYDDEYVKVLLEKNQLYTYIILGFSGILFLLIILIIVISCKKNKKKSSLDKKNKEIAKRLEKKQKEKKKKEK